MNTESSCNAIWTEWGTELPSAVEGRTLDIGMMAVGAAQISFISRVTVEPTAPRSTLWSADVLQTAAVIDTGAMIPLVTGTVLGSLAPQLTPLTP